MASSAHCFNDEFKEALKEKDYTFHFKRDNFTVYTEAMVKQGGNMR